MNKPILTIITVTYQAEKWLEGTILSVINQKSFGESVEYIIIDGKSKDKTIEIAEKYSDKIQKILSEKDSGLYDAMNKGMALAKGDYLLFLNAGDHLNFGVLSKILEALTDAPDILYSDTINVDLNHQEIGLRSKISPHPLPKKLNWRDFQRGMAVCHQSFIAKKTIAPKYDLRYRLSADQDWCIKTLKQAEKIVLLEMPIARYVVEGMSSENRLKSLKERFLIYSHHFGIFTTLINHFLIALRFILRKFIR